MSIIVYHICVNNCICVCPKNMWVQIICVCKWVWVREHEWMFVNVERQKSKYILSILSVWSLVCICVWDAIICVVLSVCMQLSVISSVYVCVCVYVREVQLFVVLSVHMCVRCNYLCVYICVFNHLSIPVSYPIIQEKMRCGTPINKYAMIYVILWRRNQRTHIHTHTSY